MYVLKHVPEDFVVEEISTVNSVDSDAFTFFKLWKRNLSTLDAVQKLSRFFRVSLKDFGFAGIKDKSAVSIQICSVRGVRDVNVSFDDMRLEFFGFGKEPVHLGDLKGNKFTIVVRNIEGLPKISSKFRNLFGSQRFGTRNVEIGRCIVKRDFERAALLVAESYSISSIKSHLGARDWLGALRCVPRRLLVLFVHAYQSFLWNKAALLSDKDILPIVGFGVHEVDDVTMNILSEENVKASDFVVRQMPELSAEGSERSVWAEAEDLKVGELQDDEFFVGKKKVVLSFFLPKGCYATEFIRQNFL